MGGGGGGGRGGGGRGGGEGGGEDRKHGACTLLSAIISTNAGVTLIKSSAHLLQNIPEFILATSH